jgi:Flp pilus assembly protein TadD
MNFALGTALQVQGDHTRSLAFLQRAAKVLPEHPEAHNALGKAHEHAGDVVNARTSFERAVQLAPDEVPFLVNLARMYCGEEHYAEARKALERALRVEPFSADAHATLALVFHKLGDRPRALHHAREALAEQPDDERVRDLLRLLVVDEPGSALH